MWVLWSNQCLSPVLHLEEFCTCQQHNTPSTSLLARTTHTERRAEHSPTWQGQHCSSWTLHLSHRMEAAKRCLDSRVDSFSVCLTPLTRHRVRYWRASPCASTNFRIPSAQKSVAIPAFSWWYRNCANGGERIWKNAQTSRYVRVFGVDVTVLENTHGVSDV